MTTPSDTKIQVTSPSHLRKLARNRMILVDASPKQMVRDEIVHVPTTIRGGLMMLEVAQERGGTLTAVLSGQDGLFLYLWVPDDPMLPR